MLHLSHRTYPELSNKRNIRLGAGLAKVKKVGGGRKAARTRSTTTRTKKSGISKRGATPVKATRSVNGRVTKAGAGAAKKTAKSAKSKAKASKSKATAAKQSKASKQSKARLTKLSKAKRLRAARGTAKAKAASLLANPQFTARMLNPIEKCGPGTSVQRLYRIDETGQGVPRRVHLVFFDRHGWYCEHGRDCAAVSHAVARARKNA
jgi:hypothetical protein